MTGTVINKVKKEREDKNQINQISKDWIKANVKNYF